MKNHPEKERSNIHESCDCEHTEDITQQNTCCQSNEHAFCDEHAYCEQEQEVDHSLNSSKIDINQATDQAIKKLQQELAIANDKYVRLYAEFDNFRKRNAQERLALIETAGEKVLEKMLPIVDDFERALTVLRQKDVSVAAVEQGVELIHDKMMHLLEQAGVQVMNLEKGSPFDPALHEAITKTPVSDASLRGKIVDIIEKGYLLKHKILRYAKVIIGA